MGREPYLRSADSAGISWLGFSRPTELERERESAGLYDEALEARRVRVEQEASVIYWRHAPTRLLSLRIACAKLGSR